MPEQREVPAAGWQGSMRRPMRLARLWWQATRAVGAPFGRYDGQSPLVTPSAYREGFAANNVLGLTLAEARHWAAVELRGEALPDTFVAAGISFGLSTGTMGEPGVFLTTEQDRERWLATLLARALPLGAWLPYLRCGLRVALLLKHDNVLYRQMGRRLAYFPTGVPVIEWAERLASFAPSVLVGPPTVLAEVGDRVRLRPKLVLAGGEVLLPQVELALTEAFGVRPRNIYQATEGFLALSCAQGRLHWNTDVVATEWMLLPRGRAVPVLTDLARVGQRYRRYRMDDVIRLAMPEETMCPCGSRLPFVAAVAGRASDVLLTAAGPVYPDEVNLALLPLLGPRQEYQIRQAADGSLTIAVSGGATTAQVRVLQQLTGGLPAVEVPFRAQPPGQKVRRVARLFDEENEWLKSFCSETQTGSP